MSFRLATISATLFLIGSLVGWQSHRMSQQSKLVSKVLSEHDRRERSLRDSDPYDPDAIKKQQHEAKGILLGQLVLNEIRAWIRENAKVDQEPLKIMSASWPPEVKDMGEGPTMEFEIYLSRWITHPQQDELIARVNDMMRTSLVRPPGSIDSTSTARLSMLPEEGNIPSIQIGCASIFNCNVMKLRRLTPCRNTHQNNSSTG